MVVPLGGFQSFIVNHFHLTFHPCTLALIVFVVLGFVTPLACLTYLSDMPTYYTPDSCYSYLNTLGDLEGFITSHACDVNVIVGDFNVDFDRGSLLAKLLNDIILEFGLLACDLNFRPSVCYTYESDDSCTRSWLDHILCSQHYIFPCHRYTYCSLCLNFIRSLSTLFSNQYLLFSLTLFLTSVICLSVCSY